MLNEGVFSMSIDKCIQKLIKALSRYQILTKLLYSEDWKLELKESQNIPKLNVLVNSSGSVEEIISLKKDPILTFPWSHAKLVEDFATRVRPGQWRQDGNHKLVKVILDGNVNIYVTTRGNHSISVGIWRNEGTLQFGKQFENILLYDLRQKHYKFKYMKKYRGYVYLDMSSKSPLLLPNSKTPLVVSVDDSAGILFGMAIELARIYSNDQYISKEFIRNTYDTIEKHIQKIRKQEIPMIKEQLQIQLKNPKEKLMKLSSKKNISLEEENYIEYLRNLVTTIQRDFTERAIDKNVTQQFHKVLQCLNKTLI